MRIQKAARRGTEIYDDWSLTKPGTRWNELADAIHNAPLGSVYQGFVWFQGGNDCFCDNGNPDTSPYYLGNLTELVTSVRQLMFDKSPIGSWSNCADIPVVIVELGYWPRGGGGTSPTVQAYDGVRAAQNTFVENDPNAAIVQTDLEISSIKLLQADIH